MAKQKRVARSMIVALKVTPSEKHRLEWVAGMRGVDLSTLLRQKGLSAILAEHRRLVAAVERVRETQDAA